MSNDQFVHVDFAFESDDSDSAAAAAAPQSITNFPAPPIRTDDKRSPHFDIHGTASGILRRSAGSISAAWWEEMMKTHGAGDQVSDAFLQAPPPDDIHFRYAKELLEALGSTHRYGLWGIFLSMSGKEMIPPGDLEVDLGIIAQPMTVSKTMIVNLADFAVLTANAGVFWWEQPAEQPGFDSSLFLWAKEMFDQVEKIVPGGIEVMMSAGRRPDTAKEMNDAMVAADPNDPKYWGYTRLGAALNILSAPALEEIIVSCLKKSVRVQFDGEVMIQWLDQVHKGMNPIIGRMTEERKRMFDILNPQVRSELRRRSATTQESKLLTWTQQFKITNSE